MAATKRHPAITDAEIERIQMLHKQGLGCRAIARSIGRSAGLVSRVAAERGLFFDTSGTELATRCHVADADYRRVLRESAAWDRVDRELSRRPDAATAPSDELIGNALKVGHLVDLAVRAGRKG